MMMHKPTPLLATCALLLLLVVVPAVVVPAVVVPAKAALILLDQVAVIVNDDVIMQSVIEQRFHSLRQSLGDEAPPEKVLRAQLIEQLIVENLQLQLAEKAGIRVSDAELNETMLGIAAQNQLTLEEFQKAVTNEGTSWQEMREQMRQGVSISQVQQGAMRQRIQITEQEIKNFLASETGKEITDDEYNIAHILLSFPPPAGAKEIQATKDRAEQLRQEILAGGDFASLAKEWSSGQSAAEGGDMGWRKPGKLPSVFGDRVTRMAIGEVPDPIKSGTGYHLIRLLNKRGAAAEGQINQSQVRHVLIKPNEIRTAEEAEELAKKLRAEVVDEGADFAEIAKLHSDDSGSALSDGDLNWNRAGAFVSEFEEVIRDSELNQVSEVFKTQHGYHFLEVTGRRVEDFTERFKMGQADSYLRRRKFNDALESWLRELRDEAFVEIKIQE